ncbi:hypothetical protein SLEP1_g16556 [Rubroshorea leprosula]|uniref:Glycosyltransferase N-terminal domain-containing protein n=1 Tax=Rubroshorea leprosula TaxID=152421 RepID=A0AAV5IYU6_9ROSI|nr:hypothetical protein SLEP1_g16556 [Rubroshorea leprosula]
MERKPSVCENQVSHVLVFPFPAQGHINPMLQFSKRLASKGLRVTLINVTTSAKPLQLPTSSIVIESIEFDEGNNKDEVLDVARSAAIDGARSAGIDGAPFYTQPWRVNVIYYHLHLGTLKVPLEEPMAALPSMPVLEATDLPSFVCNTYAYPGLLNFLIAQFSNLEEARWIFCNTFDKLEDEVIKWMANHKPIKTIGPTVPSMYLEKRLEDDKDYGLNLFKPDVMPASGEEQMEEIAWGLKWGNSYFLWVVRETEQKKLPSNFVEEILEKGLVVSWSTQLRVLAHEAIRCFMTHCGWNLTLEALSLGVPMVAMPQWSDQPTNAKFVEDVWKVGIRVKMDKNGIIRKEEIEWCIREVMDGEKSMDIRSNLERWKKLSKEALDEGGSSNRNIDEFVAELMFK